MSDRDSESSSEWVLLDDGDTQQEAPEDNLHLEPNLDSASLVASDSSSLSGVELEWQYDLPVQFNNVSSYDFSRVEDIDFVNPENRGMDDCDKIDDISMSDYDSSNCLNDNIDLDLASVEKVHCYKHKRNDHLNFILNLTLAVVVSSAIGLGTGHFLGWSHKCWRTSKITNDVPQPVFDVAAMRQTVDSLVPVINGILDSPNLSEKIKQQPSFEVVGHPSYQDGQKETVSAMVLNYNKHFSIQAVSKDMNVLNIYAENTSSNTSADSDLIFLNSVPKTNWDDMHEITVPIRNVNPSKPGEEQVPTEKIEHLEVQDKLVNIETKFFDILESNDEKTTKVNFTSQLRDDLIQVIQTLNIFIVSQFTNHEANNSLSDLEQVHKFYADLQNIIVSKLSFIENFVQSEEFQKYPKYGMKHMRKMVFSLIDSLDNVVKRSLKMLNKFNRKLNAQKFAKNMSKIVSSFDQKWLRNQNTWSQSVERAKSQEQKRNSFRESKQKIYKAKKREASQKGK